MTDEPARDDPAPCNRPDSAAWIAGMRRLDLPHPSRLAVEDLLRQCELTMTRRGGPGGQHRNKTSTAVVLHHRPTGITAEASERRSQADNRRVALQRLRLALAVQVRCVPTEPPHPYGTPAGPSGPAQTAGTAPAETAGAEPKAQRQQAMADDFDASAAALRQRYGGGQMRVSEANPDRAAVISLVLDDLAIAGGQPQSVAERWHSSASQLLRLLRSYPPALAALNRCRAEHSLGPLR